MGSWEPGVLHPGVPHTWQPGANFIQICTEGQQVKCMLIVTMGTAPFMACHLPGTPLAAAAAF